MKDFYFQNAPIEKGTNYKIWANGEFECWGWIFKKEATLEVEFYYPDKIKENNEPDITNISIAPFYNNHVAVIYTIATARDHLKIFLSDENGNMIQEAQSLIINIKGKIK